MERIILDGYLDDQTLPDDLQGTAARFQLVISPTEDRVDELVIPCRVVDPELAHAVVHDPGVSDLLRVTGHLQIPRNPSDGLLLQVTAIHVLETGYDLAHVDTDDDLRPEKLPEHGLLERIGSYQVWHDPIAGRSSVWHTSGEWTGDTDDPSTLSDLIDGYEQRTVPAPPTSPTNRWRLSCLYRVRKWLRRT